MVRLDGGELGRRRVCEGRRRRYRLVRRLCREWCGLLRRPGRGVTVGGWECILGMQCSFRVCKVGILLDVGW